MKTKLLLIRVSETIGQVSAELFEPDSMKSLFVFAHGAGAGMNHPFMTSLSNELAVMGIGTLRFNFPFTENKKKRPDMPAVAYQTIEAIVKQAEILFPQLPLFIGGKSFGGRMSSQLAAKQMLKNVKGLIFVGFPLHPPGKPSIDRADHLKEIKIPLLFLQGTRDELADWNLIKQVTSTLPLATLQKFDGADHSFKVTKQYNKPKLAESISEWVYKILTIA